jgi:hypothetical protein
MLRLSSASTAARAVKTETVLLRFTLAPRVNKLADAGRAGNEEDFETISIKINGG